MTQKDGRSGLYYSRMINQVVERHAFVAVSRSYGSCRQDEALVKRKFRPN